MLPCIYSSDFTQKTLLLQELKNLAGIYCWYNITRDLFYIGSSNNLRQRMTCYLSLAYLTSNQDYSIINRALLKYGFSSFVLLILETLEQGKNGGGSSSAPATPVAPLVEKEIISPISGVGRKTTEELAKENLGFSPFLTKEQLAKLEAEWEAEKNQNSPNLLSAMQEITALAAVKEKIDIKKKVVAADLEALILPSGENKVYMASWYNGETYRIFDISQYGFNTQTMLEMFWQDLINNNQGRTAYFHNFGGYDAILSLPALIKLPFLFSPIMKDGEIIAIKVTNKGRELLTIKDSIRILPGALSKLAKDWGAETQKDHFPHYFFNKSIELTLSYVGPIPAYEYFESKRTSQKDYEEMVKLFEGRMTQFFSKLSQNYVELLNDNEYYDVTIEVDNVKIPSHKNILCCRSPYLRRVFSSNKNQSNIKLPNISLEIFKIVLR
jgi:hypothetical protein